MSLVEQRWFYIAVLVVSCGLLAACGSDISISADDEEIDSDQGTTIRVDIGADDETLEFETDLGGFWSGTDQSSTMTTGFGGADIPFHCNGEVGTATITVTWEVEDLEESIQIECV